MDSQEGSRLTPADSLEHNAAMVKQSASLPPAFQVRPQGPPSTSPRYPINNGPGGPRLGGPQPPPILRRLDSRSSLVTGQRTFGPTSLQGPQNPQNPQNPQGPPIRPQGFPQRPPQPQLFPGQNQGFPNSPGGGPPRRFPLGPPQGQRLQTPPGPRSLITSGQPTRPQINQQALGPTSLQLNTNRPQAFPQRTSSQSSIRSESPEESRPGTPSSGGRLSTIFPQRQLMSGPEGLPPQTNFDTSREYRNDLPINNDSPLRRNPLDPKNFQNSSPIRAGKNDNEFKNDGKMNFDSLTTDTKLGTNILGSTKADYQMESFNGKQKLQINNDDDDDVVFDSDTNKTAFQDKPERSDIKYDNKLPSKSPEISASRTPTKFHQEYDSGAESILERRQSGGILSRDGQLSSLKNEPTNYGLQDTNTPTPEPTESPGPREMKTEVGGKLYAREGTSESPISRTQSNVPSPIPPTSLESTPRNSPKPRAIPSPLSNQEFEKRLASGPPETSPKSLNPNIMGFEDGNLRSLSSKSPLSSSSPSPVPPKSPIFHSQSPNLSNPPDSPGPQFPISLQKSPGSTPQSPNLPKSPGLLRSSEGEKSGRSTPDVEGGKKRATFAKDLIMSGNNKDDVSAASTLSDVKDLELTTPEESSKGTPTTPSKGTPGTPKKSFASSADRNRHRSRSPKSDKGKSPEKESAATRQRSARESKDRNKNSANRSRKTEGDNDSGVDESTQGHDLTTNGDAGSPTKTHSKIPGPKRSTSSSPTKSPSKSAKGLLKTPDTAVATSASADKKKLPMNKIQVGAAPSPNLKTVRSKIGSLENTSYKPGGGKIKIENRKLDFSKAQPKIAAKNDKYTPSGGDKKITQVKLQWNAKPKVGSLENSTYKPGGGDKKIETVKLDFKEKAKPKVASKDNVKHVPGGGTVKSTATPPETPQKASDDIETLKIEVKAESKVGSMDNVKHKPGGGDKKIFNDKDYLRQTSSNVESLSGSGSQESQGNVVLNVISPLPSRKVKKLAEAEDGSPPPSSHKSNSSSPVSAAPATTPTRPKSRPEPAPVPLTTTPVEEKKTFPQSRKSSLVKTPDRAKTPEVPKKVTIADTDEVRAIEMRKNAKSPMDKTQRPAEDRRPPTPRYETGSRTPDTDSKPSTPHTPSPLKKSSPETLAEVVELTTSEIQRNAKSPMDKSPRTPEEKKLSIPRNETTASKTPEPDNKQSLARTVSPLKKSLTESIADTEEGRGSEIKRNAKSPMDKSPRTPDEKKLSVLRHETTTLKTPEPDNKPSSPRTVSSLKKSSTESIVDSEEGRTSEMKRNAKSPMDKSPRAPEEKRLSVPRHETTTLKTPEPDNKPNLARTVSPLKKSPSQSLADTEEVRTSEMKRNAKSPMDKSPRAPEEKRLSMPKQETLASKTPEPDSKLYAQRTVTPLKKSPSETMADIVEMTTTEMKRNAKSPMDKRPKTPEEKRPIVPRHETTASKTPEPVNKPSAPRTVSPLKKSLGEERQKSPGQEYMAEEASTPSDGRETPRRGRLSPPNSLPLNNPEGTNEKMRKSSSKEFRLPKIVSNMLPELSSQDSVISAPGSDAKIALPKLVDTPTPPSRAGVAQ